MIDNYRIVHRSTDEDNSMLIEAWSGESFPEDSTINEARELVRSRKKSEPRSPFKQNIEDFLLVQKKRASILGWKTIQLVHVFEDD